MNLSVVIPAYNECRTIASVIAEVAAVLPAVGKEIIIVDDGSTDGTRELLKAAVPESLRHTGRIALGPDGALLFDPVPDGSTAGLTLRVIYHERNLGKGGALRTGFAAATQEIVVIQDADLEYDPQDWVRMYALIAERRIADVVYGCRFYGSPHRSLYFHHFLANRLISTLFNILYNQTLMDVEVCYKMMRREVLQSCTLTANDFGIEIELGARIALQRRWRIYEVGISYFGRTYAEGKKINWKDGVKALWYLLKYRIS
jgi:glycosyltransferase involved in cell wall biosynthesis